MKKTLVIYDKACVDSIDNTHEFLKEVLMIPTFEDSTCMLVCLFWKLHATTFSSENYIQVSSLQACQLV
jgi:hypothetical protein